MDTKELILYHYNKYPKMQLADLFKLLHQSAMGCEHAVSSLEKAIEYLKAEITAPHNKGVAEIEPLDGEYSRVYLGCVGEKLTAERLGELFFLSAKGEKQGVDALKVKLEIARELIEEKHLGFDMAEFNCACEQWEKQGYGAVHHSDIYRNAYFPAYRVIANKHLNEITKAL